MEVDELRDVVVEREQVVDVHVADAGGGDQVMKMRRVLFGGD